MKDQKRLMTILKSMKKEKNKDKKKQKESFSF
jgi:hypothetical protein